MGMGTEYAYIHLNRTETVHANGATECKIVIKPVPDDADSTELAPILTLFGRLPIGHHEILSASMPTSIAGGHKGVLFLRWSSPQWANRAINVLNGSWVSWANGRRRISAEISRTVCKVDPAILANQAPLIGRVFQFQWLWHMLDRAIHYGQDNLVAA